MRWGSFLRGFARALFILYCVEAGLFLTIAPWRLGWTQLVVGIPLDGLRELLVSPLGRGTITGFGLVHLVWGLHDLRELFRRREPIEREEPAP